MILYICVWINFLIKIKSKKRGQHQPTPQYKPSQGRTTNVNRRPVDIDDDGTKSVVRDDSSQGPSTAAARDRPQRTQQTSTTARSLPTTGNDVISKSAVIELLCAILERVRSIPPTPSKPASNGARRCPIRSDDDSDDECRLTIDESRTNRNVNEIVKMAAKLFNVPQFEVKTKMQEYSMSQSASVDYGVTSGLKRTNQS